MDTNREFINGPGGVGFQPAIENSTHLDGRTDMVQARLDSAFGTSNFFSAGYEFEREQYYREASDNTATVTIDSYSHALYAQDRIELLDSRLQLSFGGRAQTFNLPDPVFVGGSHPSKTRALAGLELGLKERPVSYEVVEERAVLPGRPPTTRRAVTIGVLRAAGSPAVQRTAMRWIRHNGPAPRSTGPSQLHARLDSLACSSAELAPPRPRNRRRSTCPIARVPSWVGGSHPYGDASFEVPSAYTGDAALACFFPDSGTKLRVHVGNSYRAPSAFERFGGSFSSFSSAFSFWGDPRLKPEHSVAFDGGIDQWLLDSKLQFSATVFYTELLESIIFDFVNFPAATDPFSRFGGYRNTGGGRARGVETSVQAAPSISTNLRVSYTYTDAESDTPTVGDDFFGVLGLSKHLFTLTATQWLAQRASVTFDLFVASDYSLSPFGALGRHLIFSGPVKGDLVVRYDLLARRDLGLDLYAKVENLFDNLYYEDGFLTPGAWAIGGLRIRY